MLENISLFWPSVVLVLMAVGIFECLEGLLE